MWTATADYADRAGLRTALRGVDTLVFVSSDGEATKVLVQHQNVIEAAADSDINHIVALSGLDADLEFSLLLRRHVRPHRTAPSSRAAARSGRPRLHLHRVLPRVARTRHAAAANSRPTGSRRARLIRLASDVVRTLAALATVPPTGQTHDITGPEALDLPTLAALRNRNGKPPSSTSTSPPASTAKKWPGQAKRPGGCTPTDHVRLHPRSTLGRRLRRSPPAHRPCRYVCSYRALARAVWPRCGDGMKSAYDWC